MSICTNTIQGNFGNLIIIQGGAKLITQSEDIIIIANGIELPSYLTYMNYIAAEYKMTSNRVH